MGNAPCLCNRRPAPSLAGSSAPIGGPHPPLLASPASAPGGPYPSGGGGGPFLLPPPPPPPPPSALLGLYAKATAMEAPNAEAGGPTGSPHKQGATSLELS